MVQSIFLNSTNVVNDTKTTFNKLRYKFATPVEFKNSKIALGSLAMYFSWFNISSKLGNNTLSYTFRDQTVNITIEDGYYSIDDINAYIQGVMLDNKHYTKNENTNVATYYMAFSANAALYSIQLDLKPIPISETNPTDIRPSYMENNIKKYYWTLPSTPETMQVNIGNLFTNLIGFEAGVYPPVKQSSITSYKSSYTPQINPISALTMTCNLVKQKYSTPNNIFYTFSAGETEFGGQVQKNAYSYQWCNIANGIYEYIDIIFYDQLNRPLELRDEEMVINILIDLDEDNNK